MISSSSSLPTASPPAPVPCSDGTENEESGLVRHSGVALVLVGARHEALVGLETKMLKDLSRAFRSLAHAHGASLAFLGNLDSLG